LQKLSDLAPLQKALFAIYAVTLLKKASLVGPAQHLGIIVRLIGIPSAAPGTSGVTRDRALPVT